MKILGEDLKNQMKENEYLTLKLFQKKKKKLKKLNTKNIKN